MPELEVVHGEGALRESALEIFVSGRPRHEQQRLLAHRHRAWRWALEDNPHRGPDLPGRIWLARIDGHPAGVLLGVPFRAAVGGLETGGYWGVDLYVPPALRGRGIGAALLSRWRDEAPLALGLGITDSAFRIELALGWQPVALPPRFVCPLTARGALLARRAPSLSHGQAGVRVTSSPDPRAGALWQRLRERWPCHIHRDDAFLRWRYGQPAPADWQWVALETGGQLEALAVFRIQRTRLRAKAWIYELWAPPDEVGPGTRLVAATVAAARAQGADLVEGRLTAGCLEPWLRSAGFDRGRTLDRFIVHAGAAPVAAALAEAGRSARGWYLTLADSGNG